MTHTQNNRQSEIRESMKIIYINSMAINETVPGYWYCIARLSLPYNNKPGRRAVSYITEPLRSFAQPAAADSLTPRARFSAIRYQHYQIRHYWLLPLADCIEVISAINSHHFTGSRISRNENTAIWDVTAFHGIPQQNGQYHFINT